MKARFGRKPAREKPARGERVLFTREEVSPERALAVRAAMVLGLLLTVVVIYWLDRHGLRDSIDGHITFGDVVYFAMVTITTVGYGDIVPVTDRARIIDALLVTPIRIFIWLIFLGTAYQFVLRRVLEDFRMARTRQKLQNHIVICGYGHSGSVAAAEMLAKGVEAEQIVVIDATEAAVHDAAEAGFIGMRGDAARERILRLANVDRARAVIVSPGRDDTNVLIVLTIRNIAPGVTIVSSVKEHENAKLAEQAGANVIVMPAQVGGLLLADSVFSPRTAEYVLDLVTTGGRVTLTERKAQPSEVGTSPRNLPGEIVVRIYRNGRPVGFWDEAFGTILAGDVLLSIHRNAEKS